MGMGFGLLKETFIALLKEYSSENLLIDAYWTEIEKAYTYKERHYHTLAHLENMLKELIEVQNHISDWNTMLFSLYYHDIVYNALKTTNEEQSAELARKRMHSIGVSEQGIENCFQQIIATKKHAPGDNPDTKYFLDADLSVLGKDWHIYEQYSQRVRKEYGIYPDFVYKPGRKKVLQHFLNMERIFKTDYFFSKYEQKARQNLLQELNSL
jgi:predicted metal-dependent HD superfamily phosphohydrolase